MPSPIAHLGMGYAIYRYYKRRLPEDRGQLWTLPVQMFVIMGLSLLPDLDIIPAIIFRDMEKYHNNFSHSLLVAFPVSLLVAALFYRMYRSHLWTWFLVCLLSYNLHIIMDAFVPERGVMLFWPLIQKRFVSPFPIFYGLKWGFGWFSLWHLWTIFTESLFVIILIRAMNYVENRKNKVNTILSHEK